MLLLILTLVFANNFQPSQNQGPPEPAELQEASKLNEASVKQFNSGNYDEALSLAKRALAIRGRLLPDADPRISSSVGNLAEIYTAKKDYKLAKEAWQRLLRIQESVFGPDDVNLAFTLDRLAILHYAARNSRETEETYKRALALREKGLGPNDPQVGQSWFKLGEFYRFEQNLNASLDSYKRALRIFGKANGVKSEEFLRAEEGITCLDYQYSRPDLHEEAEEIRKEFGTPEVVSPKNADEPQIGGVLNGRALKLVQPEYPGAAAARRLSGQVVVKVRIDEEGNVISAHDMCTGPPFLSEAAVSAALKSRFTPTLLSGQPVSITGIILYNFTRRFK